MSDFQKFIYSLPTAKEMMAESEKLKEKIFDEMMEQAINEMVKDIENNRRKGHKYG